MSKIFKSIDSALVDGNQGILSCAKRANNTQLIIAQQGTFGGFISEAECAGQITALHHRLVGRGQNDMGSRIQVFPLQTVSEICMGGGEGGGGRGGERMQGDGTGLYASGCQKHFTH